ncbi:DUF4956 domain-containing protein [Nocardioides sp. Kera G14]|uniref:DUF4956 domain-containing protein n=1 Tax=Nocardioides sp. Kera G14 TaxID=2884264 RepID=UPI001D102C3C|nr:DUF4956 domain-containing protein [Nocardioides sp. Kera G14]UDY24050.1 DUF4956 domain-containing protein [Nocardioides sp. Kera G14]
MSQSVLYLADLAAISLLVFGFFLRRHHRPELIVAFLTTNIGVLAVSTALTTSTIGAGLGLGLFGILSIIRLRSEELTQTEIAYYFGALTLGLLAGLDSTPGATDLGLMALVLVAIAVGDHPRVAPRPKSQQILVDRAYLDETALRAHLEGILGATIVSTKVVRTDIVNDTTLVDVRYRLSAAELTVPTPMPEVVR